MWVAALDGEAGIRHHELSQGSVGSNSLVVHRPAGVFQASSHIVIGQHKVPAGLDLGEKNKTLVEIRPTNRGGLLIQGC